MHRLVAYAHNGVRRFAIDRGEMLIGSGNDCHIRLPYAGVGKSHARLLTHDHRLRIEDTGGSRKGVLVNGRKVREADLEVLDEIRLGSVALLVEDVLPQPVPEAEPAEEQPPGPPVEVTLEALLTHLEAISDWVLADTASSRTLESLVIEMVHDFGGGAIFLFQGEEDQRAIKFVVSSDAGWLGSGSDLLRQVTGEEEPALGSFQGELAGLPAWIARRRFRALDRSYLLVAAFPRYAGGQEGAALSTLSILADLLILGLVHHVGQFEPILLSFPKQSDLVLAPGLVVGPSQAMARVLEELRGAVDPPVAVLLRGEPGISKELLARSLHLSSPRREGPFRVAHCLGAEPQQIEADLFGAQIQGKQRPVVREGKLMEADGGTLFLEDVEALPLDIQARLVRFLRSAEVLPKDSDEPQYMDVRLVSSSALPLAEYVARDQMRVDLAYLLSQFEISVPALRDRREDLPMLIQATVNRCCHQTGKRIQGITVKALEFLTAYDYEGNLPELENIVRRLVYLCPSGKPIDESMLPHEVRLAKVTAPRPTAHSDLNLEKLVSDCERAAIREALHRYGGNKSEAARQLGLSRNGLAMKIERLGLKT